MMLVCGSWSGAEVWKALQKSGKLVDHNKYCRMSVHMQNRLRWMDGWMRVFQHNHQKQIGFDTAENEPSAVWAMKVKVRGKTD